MKEPRPCVVKNKYRNVVSVLNQSSTAASSVAGGSTRTKSISQKGAVSARAETPQVSVCCSNRNCQVSARTIADPKS